MPNPVKTFKIPDDAVMALAAVTLLAILFDTIYSRKPANPPTILVNQKYHFTGLAFAIVLAAGAIAIIAAAVIWIFYPL